MEDIKRELCLSVEEYVAKCKDIQKEVGQYRKEMAKSFNKWRESEMAVCSHLKNASQKQIALETLGVMHKEEYVFPINPV